MRRANEKETHQRGTETYTRYMDVVPFVMGMFKVGKKCEMHLV